MMLRKTARLIVNCMDAIARIPHEIMLDDWDPEDVSAVFYGMSLMIGLMTITISAFVFLGLVGVLVGLVIEYPIKSICIILFFGAFILAGYLRHRSGGKS